MMKSSKIALICAGFLLFVRLAMMYSDYRKHGQLDWTPPIILFACLIFTLTAPMYLWSIVSM